MNNQPWFTPTAQHYFTPNSASQDNTQNYYHQSGWSYPNYSGNYQQERPYQPYNQNSQPYQPPPHANYSQNNALHYSDPAGCQQDSSNWHVEDSGGGWDDADFGDLDDPVPPNDSHKQSIEESHPTQIRQPSLQQSLSHESHSLSPQHNEDLNASFGSGHNFVVDKGDNEVKSEPKIEPFDNLTSHSLPDTQTNRPINSISPHNNEATYPISEQSRMDKQDYEPKLLSDFSAPSLPPPVPLSQFNSILDHPPTSETLITSQFQSLNLNSIDTSYNHSSQKGDRQREESAVNTSNSLSPLDFNSSSSYYNIPPPPAPLNISTQLPLGVDKDNTTHSYASATTDMTKPHIKQEQIVPMNVSSATQEHIAQSSAAVPSHPRTEPTLLDSPRSNQSIPVKKSETRGKGSVRRDPRLSSAVFKSPPSHEVKQVVGQIHSRPSSAIYRSPVVEQPANNNHHQNYHNQFPYENQTPRPPSAHRRDESRPQTQQSFGGQMQHSSSYHSFSGHQAYDQPQRPMSRNSVTSDVGVSSEHKQPADYYQQWMQYMQSIMQHPFYSQFYGGGQQIMPNQPAPNSNPQSMVDPYTAFYEYYYRMAGQWDPYADSYSQMQQTVAAGRRTPPLYNIPHRKVCLSTPGLMMQSVPSRPDEGEPARIELHWFSPCDEDDRIEFSNFPGPLMRETTFKADVRAFLKDKLMEIQDRMPTDWESAALLIAYLDFLVKNNGIAHSDDLADLLLEGHDTRTSDLRGRGVSMRSMSSMEMLASLPPSGPPSGRQSPTSSSGMRYKAGPGSVTSDGAAATLLRTQHILERERSLDSVNDRNLDRFRKLLMYGRKMEALEFACRHDIWGHAFALAFQLNVMQKILARFLNKAIRMNDPIQSFHQMMSNQVPAAVTAQLGNNSSNYGQTIDWGDWRPHLAMILSVQSDNPDLAAESIERLGDTLAGQQLLYASQLCYLLAGVKMCDAEGQNGKILLLGANHHHFIRGRNRNFDIEEVAINEAIQFTEIYEYAMSLADRNYYLPHLQPYKFIYATRLLDAGLIEQCFRYCFSIARVINRFPRQFGLALINGVLTLSERLQFHPDCEVSFSSNEWIAQLRDTYYTEQVERNKTSDFDQSIEDANLQIKQEPSISMDSMGTSDYSNTQAHRPQQERGQQRSESHNPPVVNDSVGSSTMPQQQFDRRPSVDSTHRLQQQAHQSHDSSQFAPPSFVPPQPYTHQMQSQATNPPQNSVHKPALNNTSSEPQFNPMLQQQYQSHPDSHMQPAHGAFSPQVNSMTYNDAAALSRNGNNTHSSSDTATDQPASVPPSPSKVPNQSALPFFNPMQGPNPGGQFFNPAQLQMQMPQSEDSYGVSSFDYFSNIHTRQRTISNSSTASNQQQNRHPYSGQPRSRTASHSSNTASRSRQNSSGQHQMPPSSDMYQPKDSGPPGSQPAYQQQRKDSAGDRGGDDNKSLSQDQQQQQQQQAGWLGGLFSKFRKQGGPKEAHLPDDNKPSIVWDPKKNDWIDTTKSEEENQALPPPPKLPMSGPQSNPGSRPPFGGAPPLSARQPRSRYVNVLQGKTTSVSAPNDLLPPMPGMMTMPPGPPAAQHPQMQQGFPVQQQPQFFVPPPGPQ